MLVCNNKNDNLLFNLGYIQGKLEGIVLLKEVKSKEEIVNSLNEVVNILKYITVQAVKEKNKANIRRCVKWQYIEMYILLFGKILKY